ncbi:hypothetical protein ACHAXT_010885 [Thalassiosira profunda]
MLPPTSLLAPALLLGAAAPLAAAAASKTVPRRVRVNVNGEEQQRLLQQPNDECANAEAVSSLPYQSMGSTLNVLPDFDAASCDADADAAGVWYSYTPTSDNTILKASVDSGLGIRMYTGDCGDALVCNVVFKTGEMEFIGMAGVEYKLLVSSQTFGAGASFTLTVEDLTPTEAPTTAAPSPSPTTSYQSYDNDDDEDDTATPVPSPALGQSPSWRYQGNYRQSNETTIAPTAAGGSATTPDNDSSNDSSGDDETMSLGCKSSKSKSYSYKSKSAKAFAKTGKGSISMSHSAKSEKSSLSYGAKSEKSMSYGGKGGKDSKCDGDPMGKSAKGSGKGGKGMNGKTGKEAYGEGANELNSLLRYGDLNGAGRWSGGTRVWAWTLGLAVWASCSR